MNRLMRSVRFRQLFAGLLPLAVGLGLLVGGSPAAAQAAPTPGPGPTAVADDLRPGDIIRLRIYREPEMSGDFLIDENGVVVLPKVGPFRPGDGPTATLQDRIIREYRRYLNHSSIDVTLLRRVQVVGAVRNPGLYPVDATLTLGDAVALAGGPTPQGHQRRIDLIRDGQRVQVNLAPETSIASSPLRSGDQIFVPERSWISRNPGVVAAALSAAVTLSVALLR